MTEKVPGQSTSKQNSYVRCVSGGGLGASMLCFYSQSIENWKRNWNKDCQKKLSVISSQMVWFEHTK